MLPGPLYSLRAYNTKQQPSHGYLITILFNMYVGQSRVINFVVTAPNAKPFI